MRNGKYLYTQCFKTNVKGNFVMLPIECIFVFYMRLENTVLTNDRFNEVSTFLVRWELNLYTQCARILGFK
jgi:hypothetical protein